MDRARKRERERESRITYLLLLKTKLKIKQTIVNTIPAAANRKMITTNDMGTVSIFFMGTPSYGTSSSIDSSMLCTHEM